MENHAQFPKNAFRLAYLIIFGVTLFQLGHIYFFSGEPSWIKALPGSGNEWFLRIMYHSFGIAVLSYICLVYLNMELFEEKEVMYKDMTTPSDKWNVVTEFVLRLLIVILVTMKLYKPGDFQSSCEFLAILSALMTLWLYVVWRKCKVQSGHLVATSIVVFSTITAIIVLGRFKSDFVGSEVPLGGATLLVVGMLIYSISTNIAIFPAALKKLIIDNLRV